MADQVLHLVVPGLLGPMPSLAEQAGRHRFPVIERWLSRSDTQPVPAAPETLVCGLFGVSCTDADLPTAALAWQAETDAEPTGVLYHATPVHLAPDQDRLLLFDSPVAGLTAAETEALAVAFNGHFQDDGWRLDSSPAGGLYLRLAEPAAVHTSPLGEVIGRNVDLFLPRGPDAAQWRARMNEIQMLFHGLPLNEGRVAAGRPAISGLWFHGGGEAPVVGSGPALTGEAPAWLRGLARRAAATTGDSLSWLGECERAVWDGDPHRWLQAVSRVETRLAGLREPAVLYPGNGIAYRLTSKARWRWWRRPRPLLSQLLDDAANA